MCNKCSNPNRATRVAMHTLPMGQFTTIVGAHSGDTYLLVADVSHYDPVWGFSRVLRRTPRSETRQMSGVVSN